MRVLVTGHTGFLGRLITSAFSWDFVGLSRSAGTPAHDLAESPPRLPMGRSDLVIHAAGTAHGSFSKEQHLRGHVLGTENLLLALAASPPSAFVLISSVAVYGLRSGIEIDETQAATAGSHLTAYGDAKRQAEEVCEHWCIKNGVDLAILRLPLVAAPDPPGNLGSMVRALKSGHYIGPGAGTCRRSIVMGRDVAQAIPRAISVPGTYNLTDGHHPNLSELEDALCLALGRASPRRVPLPLLYPIAALGSALCRLRLHFPINMDKLAKLSNSLTFSDRKARRLLDWGPSRVIDHAREIVS